MIVQCPHCQRLLRSSQASLPERLTVVCPKCQGKFQVHCRQPLFRALIAHEDSSVRTQLYDQVVAIGGGARFCSDAEDLLAEQVQEGPHIVLLDVAFNGNFPFQLIEAIRARRNPHWKIVLLPSIYNRTAYKKRPDALYGADAYLELHHIGDRLLAVVAELFPDFANKLKTVSPAFLSGGERELAGDDLFSKAEELAGLLVADILLYHQEALVNGVATGQQEEFLAVQLEEGRRMLAERLPATRELTTDFIQQAFQAACRSYTCC